MFLSWTISLISIVLFEKGIKLIIDELVIVSRYMPTPLGGLWLLPEKQRAVSLFWYVPLPCDPISLNPKTFTFRSVTSHVHPCDDEYYFLRLIIRLMMSPMMIIISLTCIFCKKFVLNLNKIC